jgi:hypothetical protein
MSECWNLAAAIVWIATRDKDAFNIPAGKVYLNAPAQCIFDDDSDFRPLAEYYVKMYRYGTARDLTPAEEVARSEKELFASLSNGCLSAMVDGKEAIELQFIDSAVGIDYRNGHFRAVLPEVFNRSKVDFRVADVRRIWPAGSKNGAGIPKPKVLTSQEQAAEGNQRKRGPVPKKLEAATNAMIEDVREGRLTRDGLKNMLEKTMANKYGGVSRDTVRKARLAALSQLEFVEDFNSDK